MFVVALFFIAVPVTVSVAEMFPTNVRCTAGAIAYNLAFTVFGGTAPFVATALVGTTGSKLAPAYYVAAVAAVSFLVVLVAYRERAVRPGSGNVARPWTATPTAAVTTGSTGSTDEPG